MTTKKTILLHTCCAPCMSYVYELLKDSFNIVSYFFNPNISLKTELTLRLNELRRFSALKEFTLIESTEEPDRWLAEVAPLAVYGERSARCFACFRYRLRASFEKASELEIDMVGTSLSISPHKDADMINKAGMELSGEYNASFYQADFKKKDGYKKSVELSRMYGFYRQNYCGCIFSKNERGSPLDIETTIHTKGR